jgi:glycerol-3-phosphate O-acyltransferase/dihydroxyacetone phosphate acyltransferase
VATWRVLLGVWAPKRWDLSLAALSQYTTPLVPKANEWIDHPNVTEPSIAQIDEPPVQSRPKRRPPSRRIMRHILRARAEAARALASFFEQLDMAPEGKRVQSSVHLAKRFGGWVEKRHVDHKTKDGVEQEVQLQGWRSAQEVISFLKKRGAKIARLELPVTGAWAALGSDNDLAAGSEDSDAGGDKDDDIVFVPSGQRP